MRKFLVVTASVALVAVVLAAIVFGMNSGAYAASAKTNNVTTIHVVEHAITDTVGDTDNGVPAPDALGNVLAFHNPVFDAANKSQVGHDNGDCVRTVIGNNGQWECFWTVVLSAGQITVEGPYNTNGTDTMLAITGGTGAYSQVRGQMRLHARGNPLGSEYDFIYELEP